MASSVKDFWTPERDAWLLERYRHGNGRALAGELGVPQWWVNYRVSALGCARKKAPNWTKQDLLRLEDYIWLGRNDKWIATVLGRSVIAVRLKRKRAGIISRTDALMSARSVADKLGLPCSKTVTLWISRGWLQGHRGQSRGRNRQWMITLEALYEFMVNPSYRHLLDRRRIVDPSFRQAASEMPNVHYLTTGEVGKRLGVGHGAVAYYISKGLLPAVRRRNWLIPETALDGFLPLCERSRKGRPVRRFSPQEDKAIREAKAEGQTLKEIARILARPIGSIGGRWSRLLGTSGRI